MQNKQRFITFLLFLITTFSSANSLATIVRMEFMFGNNPGGEAFIELFDQGAPDTVANFLNYVENSSTGERRFDGTFIHRSAFINNRPFIIQGGGYKYDPSLGEFRAISAPHIETYGTVMNEFDLSRSNLRGTIAMAKLDGDPNSATSEWFFNLMDNSANLDDQNGGFTVFGTVLDTGIDTGMDVIDTIAALQTVNAGSAFSELPGIDFVSPPVTQSNLITIKPSIFLTGYPIDFGLQKTSTVSQTQSLTMKNSDTGNLTIGSIDLSQILPPLSATDNCSGQTLLLSASCTIDFIFNPTAPGNFSANITIALNSLSDPFETTVKGRGAHLTPTLEVTPTLAPGEFGNNSRSDEIEKVLTLLNSGDGELQIESVLVSGLDSASFTITDNSCNQNLALAGTCTVTIKFADSVLGDKTAILSINTIPANQTSEIILNGKIVSLTKLLIETTTPIEMDDTLVNTPVTQDISFKNDGIEDLIITGYNFTGNDASNFSISNDCLTPIAPTISCSETLTFSATTIGDYTAILEISSNDPDSPVTAVSIAARVVLTTANLVLDANDPLEMRDTSINQSVEENISLMNSGNDDLIITGYNFTGTDASNFSITNLCVSTILPGEACSETIMFSSAVARDYSATLEISSNDPDTPVTSISIIVNVSEDNDGVPDAIEMAAPNGGDNNRDGIPDSQQGYVASFPDINGQYLSLETDSSLLITNVNVSANPSVNGSLPIDANSSIAFPYGFIGFNIENVAPGGNASATLYLPENTQLPEFVTYYKYRPPSTGSFGGWFSFDARTFPVAGIGAEFNSNTVTLNFIDGAIGDNDTDNTNGIIQDPGGIAFITPTIPASSAQSSGGCTLQKGGPSIGKYLEWLLLLCGLIFYPLSRQSALTRVFGA